LIVDARQLSESLEWTSGGGSRLTGVAGDWLLSSGDDSWTVLDDVFRQTYEKLSNGRWRKSDVVRAVQVDHALTISTPEGRAAAGPGDWVIFSEIAGAWPVTDADFQKRYEKVGHAPDDAPTQ
jgi:hypothetical protein